MRLDLPGGREVRLIQWVGDDGESGHLTVSVSWPEKPLGGRTEDSLRLPADALPEVRQALAKLDPTAPGTR